MITTRVAYLQTLLQQTNTLLQPLGEVGGSGLTLSLDAIALPLRLRHTPLAAKDLAREASAQRERQQRLPSGMAQGSRREDDALMQRAVALEASYQEYGVPLAALALQFSLRDARIASTIGGISRPERLHHTIALADHPIPAALRHQAQPLSAGEILDR